MCNIIYKVKREEMRNCFTIVGMPDYSGKRRDV